MGQFSEVSNWDGVSSCEITSSCRSSLSSVYIWTIQWNAQFCRTVIQFIEHQYRKIMQEPNLFSQTFEEKHPQLFTYLSVCSRPELMQCKSSIPEVCFATFQTGFMCNTISLHSIITLKSSWWTLQTTCRRLQHTNHTWGDKEGGFTLKMYSGTF